MEQFDLLLGFLSPLESNKELYKGLSELIIAKLEAPHLSIRAAKKWGIPDLSTSFYYDQIKKWGELFINGVISLEDFLLFSSSNTKVCDATYLKRGGKKVYGAKKIKNYVVGCYELLQDVLFIVGRYKGLNFIIDYNFIQYLRLYLPDMSFKDVLENISAYLLSKYPPKCVFSLGNAFERMFEDI